MATPFLAEIRIFPYNFAPKGYAFCTGQILAISQNTALFSLLGTTYGGNGTSNFALPNLQGSSPIGMGQGPGLSQYVQGEVTGSSTVTLLATQIPSHNHAPQCYAGLGNQAAPTGHVWAKAHVARASDLMYTPASTPIAMMANLVGANGGGQPHNNLQPYLVLNYCIALQGIFPARS